MLQTRFAGRAGVKNPVHSVQPFVARPSRLIVIRLFTVNYTFDTVIDGVLTLVQPDLVVLPDG